jgi:hypothetical protein
MRMNRCAFAWGILMFAGCWAAPDVRAASYNSSFHLQSGLGTGPTATPTTNGNVRYQWRKTNFSAGSGSWLKFEWNSWNIQAGANPGSGASVSPSDNLVINGSIRFRTNSGQTAPDNIGLNSVESGKTYVLNLTDNGNSLDADNSNSQIAFSINEINHQNTLVTFGSPSSARSGGEIRLNTASTAESSGSSEEIWVQWTKDNFSTKNFVQMQTITNTTTLAIALGTGSDQVKELDTNKWLAATMANTTTGSMNSTTAGLGNFDVGLIERTAVQTFVIDDDDTTGPSASGFVVNNAASVTDGDVVSGGYSITGLVQDAGSGINVNGVTVSGDDFSPNYDILNNANTEIANNQTFSTVPSDGGGQSSAAALATTAAAAGAGGASTTVDLGTYEVTLSITDNDEDATRDTNDRKAVVNSQVATFTVVDDDTTGPSHSSFTGNSVALSGGMYTNADLASGLSVAGSVQDGFSGVFAGSSNTYTLTRNGTQVDSGTLTAGFSNGGAQGSPGSLSVTLGAGVVQPVGVYTLRVTSVNYDIDRSGDTESTTSAFAFEVEAANVPPGIGRSPTALSFTTMVGVSPAAQTFGVTNIGGQTLYYTNTVSYGSGSGWLSVAPAEASASSGNGRENTATVSVATMSAGNYSATIMIADAGATNSPQTVSVALAVTNIPSPSASVVDDGPQLNRLTFSDANGRQILVVYRQGSAPSADPAQGTSYSVGNSIGSGTVLYKGSGAYLDHVVVANATHYYRFYAIQNDHYSPSAQQNTTTPAFQGTVTFEQASYTNNTSLNGLNGGQAWGGAWSVVNSGSGNFLAITNSTTATFTNKPAYTTNYGNRIRMTAQGNGGNGRATRSFSAVSSGKIYVGYMLSYQFNGAQKWAGLSFMSNTTEKAFFGEVGFADKELGLSYDGNQVGSSYNLNDYNSDNGNVYLVVGAYDFSTRELKVKSFYRTTAVPMAEPSSWDATATLASGYLNSIDGIRITAGSDDGGATVGQVHWDEIRVARTWADLVNTIAPVVTNYTVDGAAAATDGQVKDGAYSVTMDFYDPVGLTNATEHPNYDVYNPSSVQITTDRTFTVKTFAASGTQQKGSNSTQNASSTNVVELGAYTLRWSHYNSNGVGVVNSTTLSNGTTALSFTVTDDDSTAPAFGTALAGRAFEFRINTTNYTAGSGTGAVASVTDGDLVAVSGSNPMRFLFSVYDPSSVSRNSGGPLADVMNFDIGPHASLQNIFGTYDSTRSTSDSTLNTATSAFYHTAAFSDSELTSLIGTRSNIVTLSAPDLDGDRNVDDRTKVIDQQIGIFEVLDDDTNAPVASSFTAVDGAAYTVGDLSGGLLVTGLIQDAGSGVYGGTSNRYQLLRNGTQVDSGAFTTRPAANGDAMSSAEALAVTLSGANVDVAGTYTFIVLSRDYDVDRSGDSLVGSNSYTFSVSAASCPPATPPTLTQPGNQYISEDGGVLSFNITASDSAGCTAPTFTYSTLPSGASFNSTPSGSSRTGTFSWNPDSNQSGTYPIRFTASDGDSTPTSLIIRVYVADTGEATNSAGVPVSQTNWHVSITNIQIPSSGNITVVYAAVNGVAYDVYRSDQNFGGAMTWTKVVDEEVASGSTDLAEVDASVSQRYFQVVLAGGSPSSNGVWAVIRPTINASTFTLVSPGTAGDRKFNGELGTNLAKVLTGNDGGIGNGVGDEAFILNANQSWRNLYLDSQKVWRESNGSVSTYELAVGQGFYILRNGASAQPRLSGPVGNSGTATNVITDDSGNGAWNIITLSQGKHIAISSAFSSLAEGSLEANWDETQADLVVLQNSDGSWRRIMRAGDDTWFDLSTFAPANFNLSPGTAVYFYRQPAGTLRVRF